MMDGETKLVGVMGWPIAHSLSPAMHNAAFDALGMNWRYVPLPVRPSGVGEAVDGLRAMGFDGCNVTVPHKEAVIPHLDDIPAHVRRFGAVNTLIFVRRGGAARDPGENTDVQGFVQPCARPDLSLEDKRVLIVGAGGAARGAVYGLCGAEAASVTVLNRTPARARPWSTTCAILPAAQAFAAGALTPEALARHAAEVDLLVNTTTVGMWPHVDASIWPDDRPLPGHLAVCDLVYRPLETKLLRQARQAGALAIDGLGMLIGQGALSFEMWTGQWPPEDVMRAACIAALEADGGTHS